MSQYLPLLLVVLPFLGWGFVLGVAFVWLRTALTARWVLGLFESEGEPSVRLVLAPVIVIYTLCMQSAGRLSEGVVQANYLMASTLLGLGTAKLVGKAWAGRPAAPPVQVTAKKAEMSAESDINYNGATPTEPS
jgi:hypothetical protein